MARKTPSRLELRRQQEALEAQTGEAAPKKTKKAAGEKAPKAEKPKKATSRKKAKEKTLVRKKLVWVVYSPGMKEEGRFDYDKRADAEKKVEALKEKHKKPYFIQPVKEILSGEGGNLVLAGPKDDDEPAPRRRARPAADDDDSEPEERDDDDE